jgi:hypothetical protein
VVYADALLTRLAQPEATQQPADPDDELIDLAAAGAPVDQDDEEQPY